MHPMDGAEISSAAELAETVHRVPESICEAVRATHTSA